MTHSPLDSNASSFPLWWLFLLKHPLHPKREREREREGERERERGERERERERQREKKKV
jgi:hypothetical protein